MSEHAGITTKEALAAKRNLDWIADHWADLRARLQPGGGNALTGMPGGDGSDGSPIDLNVSDLMHVIEEETRSLGHVLMDETDWTPRTSKMPDLLRSVAERYGHWTAGDERTALAFCDWAEEHQEKVQRMLERPAPPRYVGPCQHKGERGDGCTGELYLREGRTHGTCRECGTPFTREEQMTYLAAELDARLMEPAEIVRALKIIGHPIKAGTVYTWIQRGRLTPAVDEGDVRLFRLKDATALVEAGR